MKATDVLNRIVLNQQQLMRGQQLPSGHYGIMFGEGKAKDLFELETKLVEDCGPGQHELDQAGDCLHCTFTHTEPETYYEAGYED